uniref:Uncharacterized protein n=1 Tax=Anguilla anguilla TaxID=7936 RepID=A0A0E9RVQ6_ANGAN
MLAYRGRKLYIVNFHSISWLIGEQGLPPRCCSWRVCPLLEVCC